MPSTTQPESGRRRSLSGALTRRFTRNSTSTAPPSESTAKRRATIATTTSDNAQVHVRIVPNIDNPSRSLIFDIVDRVLTVGSVIRIGRYSERHANQNCMSFKSKVVSRCHCEVWVETDGKVNMNPSRFPYQIP
jgi:pSer/pThr/pTyr-binding forkhead associated (FHA) protein